MSPSWTPKYSCKDCWTGVHPMKNDQQSSNDKTLLGLKKRTPSNKPKGKRILETVNRMITRIQDDERKCLWRNTTTRPVFDSRSFSRKRWPPFVTIIRSMSPTWCVKQSSSSFRTSIRIQRIMGSWCSSDKSDTTLRVSDYRIPRTSYGHYILKRPRKTSHGVFFVDCGQFQ